jgi:hypothetical protein
MMTMPGWLARPLRRFAGTAAMFGGQAFVYGRLHPGPEMPPREARRPALQAHPRGRRAPGAADPGRKAAELRRAVVAP